MSLIFSYSEAGRPFAAPPGIPADRLGILRTAFDATMKDPKFLASAKSQNLDFDPLTGAKTTDFIKTVCGYPSSVVTLARHLIE